MTQQSLVVSDGTGLQVLSAINNALETLASNNQGSSEPTYTYTSMFWLDTSGTNPVLKIRNSDDSAWVTLGTFVNGAFVSAGLSNTEQTANKNIANGYAGLNANAKVNIGNLPYTSSITQNSNDLLTSGGAYTEMAKKEDVAKTVNVLATSGTITLTDNSVNSIAGVTGNITFTLPTVTDNTTLHQIFVQMSMPTTYAIDLGLGTPPHWLTDEAPDLSEAGNYNIFYEYDKAEQFWRGGILKKGEAS